MANGEQTTDPRLTGCADGGACVFMERHDEEIERMRSELRNILAAVEASAWHDRAGEQVKRVCFSPGAVDRLRVLCQENGNAR